MEQKAHPFELAGMGIGPFRFLYSISIPSPLLGEANPSAYSAAMQALPKDLVQGLGTCSNCGRAIMNICVIENASKERYGVGCDCVLKTEDPALCDVAKVATAKEIKRKANQLKEAKRVAKHAKYLLDNKDRFEAERIAKDLEITKREGEFYEQSRKFLTALGGTFENGVNIARNWASKDCPSIFFREIARQLLVNVIPWEIDMQYTSRQLPYGRAINIICEDRAKLAGRRYSKNYEVAFAEIWQRFEDSEFIKYQY